MKIKLSHKANWEIFEERRCHCLMVEGFSQHLAEIDLNFKCWWLYPDPESFVSVAKGKCETLKSGKKQIKDKMKELDMI